MKTRKAKKSFKNLPRKFVLQISHANDREIVCRICGKEIKSISGLGTHLLNKHDILLEDYVTKYFRCLTKNFKHEKCGFCERDAQPDLVVDYKNMTYELSYAHGYCCNTNECRDMICLDIFGMNYKDAFAAKKFEHIGSNVEYLAKLHKTTKEFICKKVKRNENYKTQDKSKSNLAGFIARYGKEEGAKRYQERCDKIRKSMTIDWFIERYGIAEGAKKYQERYKTFISAASDITYSKNQYKIFNSLKADDANWKDEVYANGVARVDMVNYSTGIAIEYFGDYWHCNPAIYSSNYFNTSLKMTAKAKWQHDKARLTKVLGYGNEIHLMIVVWENTFASMKFDVNKLKKTVYNLIKKHNKSKKEIIWI